ncbi:unnamed protein product, partial [Iphiclides podalirius]
MNRLVLVVFTVSTVSVAFLNLAESSGDPAQHKVDIPDDLEEDNEPAERSGALAQRPVLNNANRPLQLPISSSPRPGLITIDVVECHVCTDCPKVYENTTTKFCPHTLDVTRQNKCVTYAEQYKHMKRSWYIRGCASERGSCDDVRKAHSSHADIVNLLFCRECEGDKCNANGSYRSFADMTLALFTLIIYPFVGKYTLS